MFSQVSVHGVGYLWYHVLSWGWVWVCPEGVLTPRRTWGPRARYCHPATHTSDMGPLGWVYGWQAGGTHPIGMLSCYFITGRNEVGAKVMFLVVSVILSTGGGLPQCMLGYHPPAKETPCQGDPPAKETPLPRRPPCEVPRRPPCQGDPSPAKETPPLPRRPPTKETPPPRRHPRRGDPPAKEIPLPRRPHATETPPAKEILCQGTPPPPKQTPAYGQ